MHSWSPWSSHSPRTVSTAVVRILGYLRMTSTPPPTYTNGLLGEKVWSEEQGLERAPLRSDTHIAKFELPTPVRRHFRLIRNSRHVHANSRAPGTSLHAG
jgi:hypothetical protein